MASEKSMWEALRPLLSGLDPVRVENLVHMGTPDVNYTRGWIELKYAHRWPSRGGPLKLDHFTQEQKAWITRRCAAGTHRAVYVLLKVENEWLLFYGPTAVTHLGQSTREVLYRVCLQRWNRKPTKDELQPWL